MASARRFRLAVNTSGPALNSLSTDALDGNAVLNSRNKFFTLGYLSSIAKFFSLSMKNNFNSSRVAVFFEGKSSGSRSLLAGPDQTCRPISFFSLRAAQLDVFEFVRRSNSTVVELCGAQTYLLIDQLVF